MGRLWRTSGGDAAPSPNESDLFNGPLGWATVAFVAVCDDGKSRRSLSQRSPIPLRQSQAWNLLCWGDPNEGSASGA